jgi:hypothetical protein
MQLVGCVAVRLLRMTLWLDVTCSLRSKCSRQNEHGCWLLPAQNLALFTALQVYSHACRISFLESAHPFGSFAAILARWRWKRRGWEALVRHACAVAAAKVSDKYGEWVVASGEWRVGG